MSSVLNFLSLVGRSLDCVRFFLFGLSIMLLISFQGANGHLNPFGMPHQELSWQTGGEVVWHSSEAGGIRETDGLMYYNRRRGGKDLSTNLDRTFCSSDPRRGTIL